MLRELAKLLTGQVQRGERSGLIVQRDSNQLYMIVIDGATFQNVPSAGGSFHRAGEYVRIFFQGGRPVILS